MKNRLILVFPLLAIAAFLVWWEWPAGDSDRTSAVSAQDKPLRTRDRKAASETHTLERVRTAAQRKLPEIRLDRHEATVFAEIDPRIDELDVMEILLEVETEFGIDLPQDMIIRRIGPEHRRNLRSQLSLSLIAECVDEILRNPER